MNKRMIFYILGKMMGVEGIVLLIPAFVSLLYQEKSGFSFLIVSAVLILIYFVLGRKEPKSKRIYSKEGFAIVGLAWLLWSAFGALPFVLSGSIPHYIDAFFETVSGFTTTGSTILTEIEILPKGIAFWRSFTHWIGGMGVLVFVMMITSLDDDNAMPLMRAEVPGPEADKLVPKARRTAKILYGMYFALTVVETVFLMAGGMSFYDALLHAFSTAGTGGFSNKNASVGFFDSAYIDGVITIFMILFGINFNLYFLFLLKEWKTALKNEELWVYLGIIGASMAAITGNILHIYGNIFRAFPARAVQELLDQGIMDQGLVAAEGYDTEILERVNRPHDEYSVLVTLKADGTVEKTVVGSILASYGLGGLKEIFTMDSLQIASFTITEKGYGVSGAEEDFKNGPDRAKTYMGQVAGLLYRRFLAGRKPIAMVSMDNCSHNGDRLLPENGVKTGWQTGASWNM